ncbi:MAG: ABC transporter ATP-binding protein [Planctomycetota bacterium]
MTTPGSGEQGTTSAKDPAVSLRGVRFAYGRQATLLDGVDLDLCAGCLHCLLGRSGSGKSTLLRLIAGLDRIDDGKIRVDGQLVADRTQHTPPEKRRVGVMFQDQALFPHLTVRANVAFGMRGATRSQRREHADRLLAGVGLEGLGSRMPHTLSGGQQQRVALVRAIAPGPRVVLLDEPFTSLDPDLRAGLREQTARVLREAGVAALLVTHDRDEAEAIGDTISVLEDGRVKPWLGCSRRP